MEAVSVRGSYPTYDYDIVNAATGISATAVSFATIVMVFMLIYRLRLDATANAILILATSGYSRAVVSGAVGAFII